MSYNSSEWLAVVEAPDCWEREHVPERYWFDMGGANVITSILRSPDPAKSRLQTGRRKGAWGDRWRRRK